MVYPPYSPPSRDPRPSQYRLRKRVIGWTIERRTVHMWDFQPDQWFFHKDDATAFLVQKSLEGAEVLWS